MSNKKTKKYYGFEFKSAKSCTIGSPNPMTGYKSIFGDSEIFRTKLERDEWVEKYPYSRKVCTKNELRNYNLGSSIKDFESKLSYYEFQKYRN